MTGTEFGEFKEGHAVEIIEEGDRKKFFLEQLLRGVSSVFVGGYVDENLKRISERKVIKVSKNGGLKKHVLREHAALNVVEGTSEHVPKTHQVGRYTHSGGGLYIVTDYLEGVDIKDLLDRFGPFTPKQCVPIVRDLGKAISHVNSMGVLHRDIKPANVVVTNAKYGEREIDTEGSRSVLVDFSLSRVGDICPQDVYGYPVGTPYYMAPEILRHFKYSKQSEVYAFASTVREMLCETALFQLQPWYVMDNPDHDFKVTIAKGHIQVKPQNIRLYQAVPRIITSVVDRGLEKDPDKRFGDAQDFADAFIDAQQIAESKKVRFFFYDLIQDFFDPTMKETSSSGIYK